MRVTRDKMFISLIGVFIVSQLCLWLHDTNVRQLYDKIENKELCAFTNPKDYFISAIIPLFFKWQMNNDVNVAEKMNNVFNKIGIDALMKGNSITKNGKSLEFFVYVPKYKRDFLLRFTPLSNDLDQLIKNEAFRLEFKLLSMWINLPVDSLFQ